MKKNKSQISLEYATTYGWAMIIIVIIIGSLIYYGNIENKSNSKSYCDIGNQFPCTGNYLTANGELGIKFTNNINDKIIFESINITNFPNSICIPNDENISVGKEAKIICDTLTSFDEGNSESFDTKISFYTENGRDRLGNRVLFEVYGKITLDTNTNLFDKEDYCDKDDDGVWSTNILCGGNDCDDNNPLHQEPGCITNDDCATNYYCYNAGNCYARCYVIPPPEEDKCPPNCELQT